MSSRGIRRSRKEEEEESYFISMADMMVGLVFVFIILLLYFALQYQQKSKALSDAGETRAQILRDLKKEIAKRNPALKVEVDIRTGVLRLPAAILFAKGDYRLSAEGRGAVTAVAAAMAAVLPQYSCPKDRAGCDNKTRTIDAIFVEGHTDADQLIGYGPIQGNLELSALRATETYRAMRSAVPALEELHNKEDYPILSVSGYGPDRPVPGNNGTDEDAKARNRRIDLRFLMETPKDESLSNMLAIGA